MRRHLNTLYVTTQGSVADGTGGISYKFDSQVLRYDLATGVGLACTGGSAEYFYYSNIFHVGRLRAGG